MNPCQPVTIVLYEAVQDIADSFKHFIDDKLGYHCPKPYASPEHILEQIEFHSPDIILMDINVSPIKCIDSLRKLRLNKFHIPVIMLSHLEDYNDDNIIQYIRNGAHGFISKQHTNENILSAINEVLQGGVYITPNIAKRIFRILQDVPLAEDIDEEEETQHHNLSKREIEILEQLCAGLSYKLIGNELGISRHTVNAHLRKIYSKLHVHSATEAISYYLNDRKNR